MQRNQIFVLTLQKIIGNYETGGPGAKLEAIDPGLKSQLHRQVKFSSYTPLYAYKSMLFRNGDI